MVARTVGLCGAALLALPLMLLAGCGAEPMKESAPPVNPAAAPPGGGKVEDYKAGMNRVLENQRGGSPAGRPAGAPGAPPSPPGPRAR